MYPTINISLIQNPSRFYAFPVIGGVVKCLICIPIFIEWIFLAIWLFIILIVNSFSVLFTKKYMSSAYNFVLGYMRFNAKVFFFLSGLTNKYPGFNLAINDDYTIDMPMPTDPGRFFAIPFLGYLARMILLIPFSIFQQVINYATALGQTLYAWFTVLFMGRYPEAIFQLSRDNVRLNLAMTAYSAGLSDTYPSFSIDMTNHKGVKIIFIVLGIMLMLGNWTNSFSNSNRTRNYSTPYPTSYPTSTNLPLPSTQP